MAVNLYKIASNLTGKSVSELKDTVAKARAKTTSNNANTTKANTTQNNGSYLDSATGKYHTTITNADGSTQSGYILNGTSYYDNGSPINAGAKVTDSEGRVWTKGGADPDAGLSMEAYRAKYGIPASESTSPNYGDISTEQIQYNPYAEQQAKLEEAYRKQEEMLREQNRLAVQQGVNRLNTQKTNINQNADENARQAYIQYMQSKKALPQQLASQGINGGATETANLGLASTYQNNLNDINKNRINQIQDIDNAIVDLQNTGDLTTVQQVLANNQAALDAYAQSFDKGVSYNQWANNYNANRADTAWEQNYKTQAYQDSLAQQAYEQYVSEREKLTKDRQAEYDNIMNMYLKGALDVNYAASMLGIPAESLSDLKTMAENEARLSNQQKQASIYKSYNSGGGNSSSRSNGTTYKSSDTSIANYLNGQLGKNVIAYDSDTKKYGLNYPEEVGASTAAQVYSWYKDPIIQKTLFGVEDGTLSANEAENFLLGLGYSKNDIERVAGYTYQKKGE